MTFSRHFFSVRVCCFLFFFVLLFLCASTNRLAWGFDTNYQDFIVGQRATGMGGAFTAIANDPSAGFYNPAGFVGIERLKVGTNLTLYSFHYREVQNGLAKESGGTPLRRLEFTILPSTAGIATQFGGKDDKGRPIWGGGIAFMIPYRTQIAFRTGVSETIGTRQRNAMLVLQREGQTFLAGPTIARRFGSFSIGIAGFYSHRFFGWILSNSVTMADCQAGALQNCKTTSANSSISSMSGWIGSLNIRIGMLYEVNPRWTIGLMLSLSSLRLWGDGNFQAHRFSINKDPKVENRSQPFVDREGLLTQSPWPWEARIGVAFRPNSQLLLTMDGVFRLPSQYKLLEDAKILALFQYPEVVQRQFMFNFHLGGEWKIKPDIPFRFGIFTNLSNVPNLPEKSNTVYLAKVNMFGASTSIGFRVETTTLDIGVTVSYGEGYTQRLRPEASFLYERVGQQNLTISFHISGATEFLGYSVQKIIHEAGKMPIIRSILTPKSTNKKTSHPSSQPTQHEKKRPSSKTQPPKKKK